MRGIGLAGSVLRSVVVASVVLLSPGVRAAVPVGWVPAAEPAGRVVAVAFDEATGRLAVADPGAVWVGPARGSLAQVERAPGVREVAFDESGALWIAGDAGLIRWDGGNSRVELEPAAGGVVTRIRVAGGFWLAAASDGLHLRRPGGHWARMDLPVPAGAVTALAAAPASSGLRVAVVVCGEAHWLELEGAGSPVPRTRGWERVGNPGDGARSAADVWLDEGGGSGWTLLRNGCLVGPEETSCVPLPPGAEAERLFHIDRRWWVTTARGLLVADSPEGPWQRERPPSVPPGPMPSLVGPGRSMRGPSAACWSRVHERCPRSRPR